MLFKPEVNLQLGTYYLKSLFDANGGRWEMTLAAYNAGQTRVTNWLSWYDYREPAEFIETIPFTETRTYVQAVLRNADVYRRLYGGRAIEINAGN
jgi:soluble lytic murein transglycosylase